MSVNRQHYKSNKKRKRRKKIALWILTPFLVLLIGATTYGAFLYNKAHSVMNDSYQPIERTNASSNKVDPKVENTSILIIGVDDSDTRNYNSGSRSDALMLATFNEKAKSVKLVSIPRDSYVYIPKVGYEDKIAHAHAFGGPAATIETVEKMFDIPIDYYVKMNFNAFIDVVDALGGIDVEVPYTINEMDSKDRKNAINLKPGIQELNGEEALALARTRKKDSDIERGKRQQEIIKAIVNKAVSVQGITKYADIIEAVGDNLATDLTFKDMNAFIDYALAGTSLQIDTLTLKGEDYYKSGIYYYQLDDDELSVTKQILKSHLGTLATSDNQYKDSNS
ncbi:transcriptional regulator [Bacillus sp. 7504-2]|nr:transcriptional regulator [Bacillus sp. 7504-2]